MKIEKTEGFPLLYEKQDRGSPSCADVKLLYDGFEKKDVRDLKQIRDDLINKTAKFPKEYQKLSKVQQREAEIKLIAIINYFLLKEDNHGREKED